MKRPNKPLHATAAVVAVSGTKAVTIQVTTVDAARDTIVSVKLVSERGARAADVARLDVQFPIGRGHPTSSSASFDKFARGMAMPRCVRLGRRAW